MIPNEEGWHYLTVKKLSALLIRTTAKHKGYFYTWIAFNPLKQKRNLKHIKKYVKIKIPAIMWLTNEQHKSYENAKPCYIWKEILKLNMSKIKKYCKVKIHCHYTGEYRDAANSICNLEYSVPKEIPIVYIIDL